MADGLRTESIFLPCGSLTRFGIQIGTPIPVQLDALLKLCAIAFEHILVEDAANTINYSCTSFEIIGSGSQRKFLEHGVEFSYGPAGQHRHDNGLLVRYLREIGVSSVQPIEDIYSRSAHDRTEQSWNRLRDLGLAPSLAAQIYLFLSEQNTLDSYDEPLVILSPENLPSNLAVPIEKELTDSLPQTSTLESPAIYVPIPDLTFVSWPRILEARHRGSVSAFRDLLSELSESGANLTNQTEIKDSYHRILASHSHSAKPLDLLSDSALQVASLLSTSLSSSLALSVILNNAIDYLGTFRDLDWLGVLRLLEKENPATPGSRHDNSD